MELNRIELDALFKVRVMQQYSVVQTLPSASLTKALFEEVHYTTLHHTTKRTRPSCPTLPNHGIHDQLTRNHFPHKYPYYTPEEIFS